MTKKNITNDRNFATHWTQFTVMPFLSQSWSADIVRNEAKQDVQRGFFVTRKKTMTALELILL